MKKKLALMMIMLLSLGMFCACSSNDEIGDVYEGQSPTGNSETENDNSSKGTSDDFVDFQLQDEDGIECYNFNEGDNIIFRLEIINDTDADVIVQPLSEIVGFDAFRVCSIDGDNKGTPWDQIFSDSRAHDILLAHSSTIIVCPWFDNPSLAQNGREHFYSGCFYKKEQKLPLPKGEYYSKFDIKLNDKTIHCYRNFKIK